ncbi:MAG TPA: tetratricopeptide repeat protein, partial [bacterium]|nr:tetratricopeptide repeat protein [bacterium]
MLKGRKAVSEIEEFEQQIKKRPDDDRAYVRLAELYARSGNESRAIELYEKAALVFEKKGFLNKAKAVLKQALMLNSEHGKINVLLADYDRQSGLMKDALMRYQTAVNYYAKIGNKLAAINILKKIVEISPGNINFTLKLSSLLVEEKMYHEAEKLLYPLAEELKGTDKVNEYALTLKLLYAATNNDSEVGKNLVNLYLKNSSYSNALAVLQKLIIEDPDAIEFLEKLAFVFEKLGNKQKLIATYKQIASILSKRQSFAEKDDIYRKILELDPHDREALSALKEEGKLRNIITDKIEGTSDELTEQPEEDMDLVIDMDVEVGDIDVENASEERVPGQNLDIETALKESKVFMSYRLFDKAIDRLQSCRDWRNSPEALDILIEGFIELGEM